MERLNLNTLRDRFNAAADAVRMIANTVWTTEKAVKQISKATEGK